MDTDNSTTHARGEDGEDARTNGGVGVLPSFWVANRERGEGGACNKTRKKAMMHK